MSFHCPHCRHLIYTYSEPLQKSGGSNFPYRRVLGMSGTAFILACLEKHPYTNDQLASILSSAITSKGYPFSHRKAKGVVASVLNNK